MKVLHIITSLGPGGTEGMLYRLIISSKHSVEHSVICLKKGGKYVSLLREAGLEVLVVNINFLSFLKAVFQIYKFSRIKKKQGYKIITSWLYHADLVAWFVKLFCRFDSLVWNIRSSTLQRGRLKFKNWINLKILALISHFGVNKIISCSRTAIDIHKEIGYKKNIFKFIPNGYLINKTKKITKDLKEFKGTYKISMVARWHPMKDFENLFEALCLLLNNNIHFNLTIAGSNTGPDNKELIKLIKKYKIEQYCNLSGEVEDVDKIYQTSHINVLSSAYGETFPNVLAESMLNFTPCISTDVGDSKYILENVGYIVPLGNSKALAEALKKNYHILTKENDIYIDNCIKGFKKVCFNFDIQVVKKYYQDAWETLK